MVTITAPVSGRVLALFRESEGVVTAGQSLVELGDPANLEVEVDVLSVDAVRITPGTPVRAAVTAKATNLTGQRREIAVREIEETGGAIYYLGEFPVHNMETWRFEVAVAIEGETDPLQVRFTQQFYTE